MDDNNQIIIYQSEDGDTRVEVKFTGETVWLSQQQMADLYQTTRPNVVQHIRNIYADGELEEQATCKNFLQVCQERSRRKNLIIEWSNKNQFV